MNFHRSICASSSLLGAKKTQKKQQQHQKQKQNKKLKYFYRNATQ